MYNSSKKSISKIISIFLISSLLFCAYSTNSFADSGNMDLLASDLSYEAYYYNSQSGSFDDLNVSTTLGTFYGVQSIRYYVNAAPTGSGGKFLSVYDFENFKANHEYNISFDVATAYGANTGFTLRLEVLDVNGSTIQSQVITDISSLAPNNTFKHINVNFIPDLTNVTTGYSLKLIFLFVSNVNGAQNYYISQNIYLNDNDDDSGWFEQMVQWLRDIASDITSGVTSLINSISNLGTNIGSWFTNLGNNISTWLTTLGNNISTWLTAVKDGIVNKLQSVQTAITNAIDGIQQWFVNLGNRIGEFFTMLKNYILYFQHPVTLNADGVPVDVNGNPVYTNPFEDTLQSVSDTLDDWFDSLDDFILTIQSVNVQITGYLQTFTNIFNRFNAGVPIIGVIITLALIVIVIKKIMGR